ncbi:tRNA pseudouridine(38-40) synthase TruA [Phaeodactylibacter luteus]|uniref:tRNA pseudouridine synthase A n=1 Tax=Phaeodactylibacter luteus TaxID=1564516 RepID=A0A5C6RW89_9BACT|nr:tRNA pseudouridine(38-40) synthase TruA [Phaeodactylibacter luteus]TXB66314.1 tRNA pseudouridine(38-40) synthase TruA [Phaeodactylibacter luteus]
MRYFAELAYNGANYFGWQNQPRQVSVQQTLEDALSTILNTSIAVTGCGRTDTGVHAKQYFLHFDFEGEWPRGFLSRINKYLPPDIAIYRFIQVPEGAHARFDATHRAYEYHIDFRKNPFAKGTRLFYPHGQHLEHGALQEAASLLLQYEAFLPFCKTHSDAKTMRCDLRRAEWAFAPDGQAAVFHIAADRFLRGMVRLIVGMCLNVGRGKLPLQDVRQAMEQQVRLPKSLSVPPDGLYLTDIRYPYI